MTKLSEELIEIASISLNLSFIVCLFQAPINKRNDNGGAFLGYGTSAVNSLFFPSFLELIDEPSTTLPTY